MSETITVRKSGNSLIVGIPSQIARLLNIKKGTELSLDFVPPNSLILKPKN